MIAETTVRIGPHNLAGTWRSAEGNPLGPVVLMLHGFGGNRDEMQIPSTGDGVFRHMAKVFAGSGLASLRIDFRGVGDSPGIYGALGPTTQVDDALAALDWLRQTHSGSVVVLGWSLGGAVAVATAARAPVHPAALVLLTPAWNPAATIGMLSSPKTFAKAAVSTGRQLVTFRDAGRFAMGRDFVRSLFALNPVADIGRIAAPILVICGTRDTVIFPEPDLSKDMLGRHAGRNELVVLPMDHTFSVADGIETLDDVVSRSGQFIAGSIKLDD